MGDGDAVLLGREVVIGRLDDDEAELVMNACSPRGHYFFPARQCRPAVFAICDVDVDEYARNRYHRDRQGALWDALALSCLVRDNGYFTEYAACRVGLRLTPNISGSMLR